MNVYYREGKKLCGYAYFYVRIFIFFIVLFCLISQCLPFDILKSIQQQSFCLK